jgi:MFS family permease
MRRSHGFAAASAIFAVSLLAVLPATLIHSELAATSLLAGVAILFAIGECVHTVVLGPLVADMAPAHLLGRYLSVLGLTFTVSLALGPAIGGLLLQTSPDAVWWGGALAAVLAGAVLFRLGGRIPDPLGEARSPLASAPAAECGHSTLLRPFRTRGSGRVPASRRMDGSAAKTSENLRSGQ